MPPGTQVYAMCSGEQQMEAVVSNMMMGGNARVGMEDGIWYKDGELVKSKQMMTSRLGNSTHLILANIFSHLRMGEYIQLFCIT